MPGASSVCAGGVRFWAASEIEHSARHTTSRHDVDMSAALTVETLSRFDDRQITTGTTKARRNTKITKRAGRTPSAARSAVSGLLVVTARPSSGSRPRADAGTTN